MEPRPAVRRGGTTVGIHSRELALMPANSVGKIRGIITFRYSRYILDQNVCGSLLFVEYDAN